MIPEARQWVADQLASLGIPAHPYPPATLTPPAAFIIPDNPYLTPLVVGEATLIGLQVHMAVNAASGEHPRQLDTLLESATALLQAAGANIINVPSPDYDPDTATLTVSIPLELHWTP